MTRESSFRWLWPLIAALAIGVAFVSTVVRRTHDLHIEAEKPKLLDEVHAMRLALLAASQSQDMALIAQDGAIQQQCIEQANVQMTQLESSIKQLREKWPTDLDSQILESLEKNVAQFRQVYEQIDVMVTRDTNRKAYSLATGKGIELLNELDKLLEPLAIKRAATLEPAFNLRLSLRRIQTLLIPHVFEPTDEIMDKLELQIDEEEESIQKNLQLLSSLDIPTDAIGSLTAKVEEFQKLRRQIVGLSRENSNVRSEALVASQRRDALLYCENALVELERNIRALQSNSLVPGGR